MIEPEKAAATLYQIKVTLQHVRPSVWRRLLVPGWISLADLHRVLQIATGWTDSHLHQFIAKDAYYGDPDQDCDMGRADERLVRLDTVLARPKDALVYEYDFGDGWEHRIVLEKALGPAGPSVAASCLAALKLDGAQSSAKRKTRSTGRAGPGAKSRR